MGLNYDFYQNPLPKSGNRKARLHARVIPQGTIDLEEIAELIHESNTMTTADVKGVLAALTRLMSKKLLNGYRIHLEGLGYFQLTLSCPPIETPKEIRAESVRVKSVTYRPDTIMKKEFGKAHCNRVKEKSHSSNYSETEIDKILATYFMDNTYITNRQFQRICALTPSTAYRKLTQLMAAGKLKRSPLHKTLYEPTKNHSQQ
ncbi:putative histone-like DNA-binding protein [Parabacteroides sp. PF5-5]|uniref:HU family DNA-binding protein n=1 Tax=unclassified Parabacteroides TaxID=2649774 RepID=UPI0024766DF8|nr:MULTISPECIES: HU family DNA-binding protein [unclassified Parabacteroides]MDH6303638.1 putative histone-like DNA-binding protein [Parabacteroides sp. PH5-39]MDH6314960.1 putative histone-like DNA-binding protein [Parabacteroides sp. PF5-13]MDH6318297.1 putative histone-like DNA-binding protein [Parabacteroides sp. PH5-13]MDH6321770.1 putative histone-like DNA-binding protein [Parabacteroides sp. PH5-8]MDH6325894.1 putative histone-like DNA-binding protein [Parabacteroides sp. PH5-41]